MQSGVEPLRDVKVVVLGNGRIGKTQICRRLKDEPFEPDTDSTHGIGVTSTELAMADGDEPAVLNLWDFGGQDIYHGTHALFMRTRAVFLLVWTPQSESGDQTHGGMVFRNRPLAYWLEYIRHLGGPGSPVVLVQNRCDGGRGERANLPVDPALLRAFEDAGEGQGRLFKRVAYSALDDTGRAALKDALQQSVRALRETQGRPLIGRNRLAVWEQLRAWRDADAATPDESARGHRLVPYADFDALCRSQAVHSPATFAEVLHHAGMVWYRPGFFGDRMVLDQSWALDAVYALFTRECGVYGTLRRLRGRFTRPDLDALLWGRRGLAPDDQRSLLEMMEQSGICFVHRRGDGDGLDETEYVAPDLLPDDRAALGPELAARWDPSPGEPAVAAFDFPFLSPAIARAVLSDLGGLAGETALYWRYGVCLYDGASRASALVEEVPDAEGYGGQIRIQTKGDGAEALLHNLVERIAGLDAQHGWSGQVLDGDRALDAGAEPGTEEAGTGQGIDRPARPTAHSRCRQPPTPGHPSTLSPTWPPPDPPERPEVYVSFAWARERQDPLVGELIESLAGQGIAVLRDSDRLRPGDRISHFMERLSAGRCVLVVLSAAYLRSEYCMTELCGIWRNARQHGDTFLSRIVPLVQDDARIGGLRERAAHAIYWKQEHDALDALIREHGAEIVGELDFARFKLIGDFYRHVGDMLHFANDMLVPRERTALARDRFAAVRELIGRALA
jgi:internalin A